MATPGAARAVRTRVLANRELVGGIWDLLLLAPPGWGPALAGQFVQLACPPEDQFTLRRPFSLAGCRADPDGVVLRIVYGVIGPRSRGLCRSLEGDRLEVIGPLGRPFTPVARRLPVLIGGGRGIAPILMLAEQWSDRTGGLLLYGARNALHLIPVRETPFPLELATDDGSAGYSGSVVGLLDDLLRRSRIAPSEHALFACGPNRMLAALARWAEDHGFSCQASLETHFGCGMGICAGCAVPVRPDPAGQADDFQRYVFACREGPVMDAARVEWEGVCE